MRIIDSCPTPRFVVWDITYACPLRCVHCYSESGRRPARQLDRDGLYRVVDALLAARPDGIVLAGGEPLVVKQIFDVVSRIRQAGVAVVLYTGGWRLLRSQLGWITELCNHVTVSVDGATAETHDRIRGRSGSFDRALLALRKIDDALAILHHDDRPRAVLGIDFVVTRSNFDQLDVFCREIVPRFAQLSSVSFGAVIPTGLASRPDFAARELLTDEQARRLADGSLAARLQALVPTTVEVTTTDNRKFQLHPDLLAAGMDIPPIQLEPDGRVRAMPIYEGTVGNVLGEPLAELWKRATDRWEDPEVVEYLRPARSMQAWAEATRKIDLRFGSPEDRERIARRPPYERGR